MVKSNASVKNNGRLRDCLKLFATFFRIGLFTFGGGYAMLPMIQREITEKYGWATEEEVLDYYAIGQSTPGIIAINTATFIGYRRAGIPGAVFATLGMVGPSLLIITALSTLIIAYRDNEYVIKALKGIQGAVVALVAVSIVKMGKKAFTSTTAVILGIAGFVLLAIVKLPSWAIVFSTILLAVIYLFIKGRRK